MLAFDRLLQMCEFHVILQRNRIRIGFVTNVALDDNARVLVANMRLHQLLVGSHIVALGTLFLLPMRYFDVFLGEERDRQDFTSNSIL